MKKGILFFACLMLVGCGPPKQDFKNKEKVHIKRLDITGFVQHFNCFSDRYEILYKDEMGVLHSVFVDAAELETAKDDTNE